MASYVARRLAYAFLILGVITVLVFVIVRLIPGDPIRAAMQQNVDLSDQRIVEETRARFGLDRPIPVQFAIWLRDFAAGDWGRSLQTGEPVRDMFRQRLPVTLELFVGATLWAWMIAVPLGVLGALRRNSALDASLTVVAIGGVSIPAFWEGILLIYLFAVTTHLLPPSGFVSFTEDPWLNLRSVLLPTFVIGTHSAGFLARYVRSSLLEVYGQDYIRTARAKGVAESTIVRKHAARPAAIPVVTVIGLAWGQFMAGSFLVEYVFALPGLGRMGVDAIFAKDFPVIQVTLMAVAVNVLLANLVVDVLYGYLDPRVRIR
ncbi:MAG TPA: ABC transporter permease [Methylomirabilota bacterium]|nr:ABC transporter permease [Methylomirabilota bacterium]